MAEHIEDGGPAYPTEIGFGYANDNMHQTGHTTAQYYGMSLRDAFAIAAMQGAFSSPIPSSQQEKEYIAMHAYKMADEMLKARRA